MAAPLPVCGEAGSARPLPEAGSVAGAAVLCPAPALVPPTAAELPTGVTSDSAVLVRAAERLERPAAILKAPAPMRDSACFYRAGA